MGTPCGLELSNVQWVMAYRVVWWRLVGAVPVCPPVSPHKGAFVVRPPRTMRVFFCYGNAAARTFGRARRHRPYGFIWADYAWDA